MHVFALHFVLNFCFLFAWISPFSKKAGKIWFIFLFLKFISLFLFCSWACFLVCKKYLLFYFPKKSRIIVFEAWIHCYHTWNLCTFFERLRIFWCSCWCMHSSDPFCLDLSLLGSQYSSLEPRWNFNQKTATETTTISVS